MSFLPWTAIAVWASLPHIAAAQAVTTQPDPADVNAAVPAPAHVSAFKTYRSVTDSQDSPDAAWRSANARVAELKGHVGHHQGQGKRQ